jgi:hypothetical protein
VRGRVRNTVNAFQLLLRYQPSHLSHRHLHCGASTPMVVPASGHPHIN